MHITPCIFQYWIIHSNFFLNEICFEIRKASFLPCSIFKTHDKITFYLYQHYLIVQHIWNQLKVLFHVMLIFILSRRRVLFSDFVVQTVILQVNPKNTEKQREYQKILKAADIIWEKGHIYSKHCQKNFLVILRIFEMSCRCSLFSDF